MLTKKIYVDSVIIYNQTIVIFSMFWRFFKGVGSTDIWIQADFLSNKLVKGVATQGRGHEYQQWVTSYHVYYQTDGSDTFQAVKDDSNQPFVSSRHLSLVETFICSLYFPLLVPVQFYGCKGKALACLLSKY